jgi:hypothetical protein
MSRRVFALLIAAAELAATPALAQYYELSPADRVRLDALARQQAEEDAKYHAEMRAAKAKLLRSAALPAERNPLLGKWKVEGAGRSRGKDEFSQLMGMLNNPGRAMCEGLFGSGITEFKPASWSSIDSHGDDSLGPIQYRGDAKRVWAVPEHKGFYFLGFEVISPNRVTLIGVEDCPLVREGASPAATQGSASNRTPAPPNRSGATSAPPAQTASVAPSASQSSRPSDEVCRLTLLDKLGTVGLNQVRQVLDVRYKETLRGTVPNTQNLRLDVRGSGCDDPRLNATLYDFDANGILQSITYVWARPAGPAPAPIFSERVATLSRFHALPPPQSPGRLQADTAMGRLILQDMPERDLLLEAYRALR